MVNEVILFLWLTHSLTLTFKTTTTRSSLHSLNYIYSGPLWLSFAIYRDQLISRNNTLYTIPIGNLRQESITFTHTHLITLTYYSHSSGWLYPRIQHTTTHNSHFTILQHTLTYSAHSSVNSTPVYTSHSHLNSTLAYTSHSSISTLRYSNLHYSTLIIQVTTIPWLAYRCRCH